MHLKPYLGLALIPLFACAASSLPAQSAPAARVAGLPIAIGAGLSGYNADYGHGHLLGGTLWVNYIPNSLPWKLSGLGVEIEARDLNYGRSSSQPANLREDAAQGGLIYSWPRYQNFRPYAKFSEGYGNADDGVTPAGVTPVHRNHDSRTIISGGGGFEYRAFQGIWVRLDYEYQSWPNFFKHPATATEPARPSGRLNAQGFTLGAVYRFGRPRLH